MFQFKVFIGKLLSVDALASSSIMVREITSLAHEIRNHAVEGATLETKTLLTRAEGSEVFSRLGDDIGTKFKGNATNILTTNFHVEEYCRSMGETKVGGVSVSICV